MKELERDLLRQESEFYLESNDPVYGKISKTVIELLDENQRLQKALEDIRDQLVSTDYYDVYCIVRNALDKGRREW